jgi:hypothetical protein
MFFNTIGHGPQFVHLDSNADGYAETVKGGKINLSALGDLARTAQDREIADAIEFLAWLCSRSTVLILSDSLI